MCEVMSHYIPILHSFPKESFFGESGVDLQTIHTIFQDSLVIA